MEKDGIILQQTGTTRKCKGAARDIRRFKILCFKKIPIAFHNGSNYDFHFIIKKFIKTKCKRGYDDKKCEICVTVF